MADIKDIKNTKGAYHVRHQEFGNHNAAYIYLAAERKKLDALPESLPRNEIYVISKAKADTIFARVAFQAQDLKRKQDHFERLLLDVDKLQNAPHNLPFHTAGAHNGQPGAHQPQSGPHGAHQDGDSDGEDSQAGLPKVHGSNPTPTSAQQPHGSTTLSSMDDSVHDSSGQSQSASTQTAATSFVKGPRQQHDLLHESQQELVKSQHHGLALQEKCTTLESEVTRLKKGLSGISKKYEQYKLEATGKDETISRHTATIDKQALLLTNASNERDTLRTQAQTDKANIDAQIKTAADNRETEVRQSLSDVSSTLQGNYDAAQTELNTLKSAATSHKQTLKTLQGQFEEQRTRASTFKNDSDSTHQQLQSLQSRHSQLDADLKSSIGERNSSRQAYLSELEVSRGRLQQSQQEANDLNALLRTERVKIQELEGRLSDNSYNARTAENEINFHKSSAETYKKQYQEQTYISSSLGTVRSAADDAARDERDKTQHMTTRYNDLLAQSNNKDVKISELNRDWRKEESNASYLQEKYDMLHSQYEYIKTKVESGSEPDQYLQSQYDDLNKQYIELRGTSTRNERDLRISESNYKTLNGQFEDAKASQTDFEAQIDALHGVKDSLDREKTAHQHTRDTTSTLRGEKFNLQSQAITDRFSISSLETEVQQRKSRIGVLQNQVTEVLRNNETLHGEKGAAVIRQSELDSQLRNMTTSRDKATKESTQLSDQLHSAQQEAHTATEKSKRDFKSFTTEQAEHTQAREAVIDLQTKVHTLETKISHFNVDKTNVSERLLSFVQDHLTVEPNLDDHSLINRLPSIVKKWSNAVRDLNATAQHLVTKHSTSHKLDDDSFQAPLASLMEWLDNMIQQQKFDLQQSQTRNAVLDSDAERNSAHTQRLERQIQEHLGNQSQTAEFDALSTRYNNLKGDLQNMRTERDDHLASLETERQNARSDQSRITSFETRLSVTQALLDTADEKNNNLDTEVNSLNRQIRRSTHDLETKDLDIKHEQENLAYVKADFQRQVGHLQTSKADLEQQVASIDLSRGEYQSTASKLQMQVQTAQDDLVTAQNELETARNAVQAIEKTRGEMESSKASTETNLANTQSQVTELLADVEEKRQRLVQAQTWIGTLERYCDGMDAAMVGL